MFRARIKSRFVWLERDKFLGVAFRAIGIGHLMLVRREISSSDISKTVWPRITKFYGDIHTDIVYIQTGYDVIICFRSAANRTNVKILGHVRVAISL